MAFITLNIEMNLITFYKDKVLGWIGQMFSPVNQFILISNPFPLEFNDLKCHSPIDLKPLFVLLGC